jgi:hypothetical protein
MSFEVFRVVTPCNLVGDTNVSKKNATPIFRVVIYLEDVSMVL